MKRFGWHAALSALLLIAAPTMAASNIELEPIQAGPHTYYFQGASEMASQENKGFMSNAGFVVTSDGVLVFDTLGTPALGQAMIEAIGEITDQPIKRVIISHYHADHFYGLQAFKAVGAEVWAHTKGQSYLASEVAEQRLEQRREDLAPWVDETTELVRADRWLTFEDSDTLEFSMGDSEFVLYDVGGAHAPDDMMMYVPSDNILFAGDLYFTGRIPYVGDADSKVWLAAMDSMLSMDPEMVIPGHGAASRNTVEDMELTRSYLLFLREELGQAVEEMMDFEQAYKDIDWSEFKDQPAFDAANRINAYGQYLQMERESLENF